MYRKIKMLALVVVMSSVGVFAGCGKQNQEVSEENNYYTLSIDAQKDYVSEDDERIQALKKVNYDFIMAAMTKNYEDPASKDADMSFYTSDVRATYEAMNRPQSVFNSVTSYQLKLEVTDAEVTQIELYHLKGQPAAAVTSNYYHTIIHSTPQYADASGIKVGANYVRSTTITFIQENGEWKVVEYSQAAREEI